MKVNVAWFYDSFLTYILYKNLSTGKEGDSGELL